MTRFCMQGLVKSGSCRGSVGKRRCPRPINRHASTKAACYWGPRCSALDLWIHLEAKPERTLGPGATVGVLGTGSLDLPACGLQRGSTSGTVRPVFINPSSRPSRGAKPRGAYDARLPQGRPHQAGSRGGGEINAGVPREVAMMQAMTTKGASRAPARAVSFFPLWWKGSKRRREHQAKASISVQQDQD